MKRTLEAFEANNLEFENVYNEDDERREYNSIWYTSAGPCLLVRKYWIINDRIIDLKERLC